ncbi:DUF4249 domain-containing protein [Flavobacterium sp.]|uniref:DUF4249 domain-containing protein n=1 Tax=Flavobacterium sp. TaxID=239 RepID=UPI004048C960
MKLKYLIALIYLIIISCTEPYALETENFEDLLVVEATITDEYKKQNIKLSRTIPIEQSSPNIEHGASVKITTDTGLEFLFQEENDIYISNQEFKIEAGVNYTLHIQTANGNSYISTNERMPTAIEIESVNAVQKTENSIVGVEININSNDPTNTAKFYRYEFEETYKIIPPYWSPNKLEIGPNEELIVSPRTTETQICYSSDYSKTINVTTTENQTEDRLYNYKVHFLPKDDPKITNRYSILVKQYIQNVGAYNFYKTLKNLSSTGSLLSQVQPGFIEGNIKNTNNSDEKIVGYFDVTTVSKKRIFFNFNDIFPSETSVNYFHECNAILYTTATDYLSPFDVTHFGARLDLINGVLSNQIIYYTHDSFSGDYTMVYSECGDCTTFSSNIEPDFWQ